MVGGVESRRQASARRMAVTTTAAERRLGAAFGLAGLWVDRLAVVALLLLDRLLGRVALGVLGRWGVSGFRCGRHTRLVPDDAPHRIASAVDAVLPGRG